MSDTKLGLPGGADFIQPELSTTQVPISSGAGSCAFANNICTMTFAGAHGLTMAPAAGTMPNYFIQFSGATAQSGTGTINGPIFRILAIPSTTTIQFYTTVTAATWTAGSAIPVFVPPFSSILGSVFVGFLSNLGTNVAPALMQSSFLNCVFGPNCTIQYDPTNVQIIYDGSTGNTPASVPTLRTLVAASTGAQLWMNPPQMVVLASGGAGTSRISVIE
jgi:hypothetical protein